MKKFVTLFLVSILSLSAYAQDGLKAAENAKKELEKELSGKEVKAAAKEETVKKATKEEVKTESAGAKIEFKEETIDYGTIEKGADGIRKFEFTNTGTEPLIISRVYSSCGCTIPKKPEDPILPGETGEIEVKYDTKRVGPIRKTISIYSNAGPVPHPLKIKGTIIAAKEKE